MYHKNEYNYLKKYFINCQINLFNQPWQALKKRCPSSENCPQNVGLVIDATTSPLFGSNPKRIKTNTQRENISKFSIKNTYPLRGVEHLDSDENWLDPIHAEFF